MKALLAATMVLTMLGCTSGPSPSNDALVVPSVVAGFQVIAPTTCDPDCPGRIAAAMKGLSDRYPGHAGVTKTEFFAPAAAPGTKVSGTSVVVAFTLADGAVRAILVYCGVTGCLADSGH